MRKEKDFGDLLEGERRKEKEKGFGDLVLKIKRSRRLSEKAKLWKDGKWKGRGDLVKAIVSPSFFQE